MKFNSLPVIFQFILLSLASYRLQRIVTADLWPPSLAFRRYVAKRFGKDSSWYDLVTCPWCFGTYVTMAVFAVASYSLSVPLPILQAVAAMAVVGYLGNQEDE